MSFDPLANLGSFLYEAWDAERSDLITIATGVSAWNGIKLGLSLTNGTGANQPAWSATSFGGNAGVTFDGTNDELTYTLSGELPVGAVPGDIWAVCSQDAPTSNSTSRILVAYGDVSAARQIDRQLTNTINRCRVAIGNGSTNLVAQANTVSFDGRMLCHLATTATNMSLSLNSSRPIASNVVVTSTTGTRLRFASNIGASPAAFWQGQIAFIAFTKPLPPYLSAQFEEYLRKRVKL